MGREKFWKRDDEAARLEDAAALPADVRTEDGLVWLLTGARP